MRSNLNKLIISTLIFIFFILVYFNIEWLLGQAGNKLDEEQKLLAENVAHALVWLSGAFFITQLIHFLLWRKFHATSKKTKATQLFKEILVIFIYLATITVIIGFVFKKPLTGLWATSSVTALVLGFALRNIISDLFSGIAVHLEEPFVVNDWIEVDQKISNETVIGKVIDINWRSTYLKSEEQLIVIIPNSLITTQAFITNYSK
jgi:small-conductance mechanosensitive channel